MPVEYLKKYGLEHVFNDMQTLPDRNVRALLAIGLCVHVCAHEHLPAKYRSKWVTAGGFKYVFDPVYTFESPVEHTVKGNASLTRVPEVCRNRLNEQWQGLRTGQPFVRRSPSPLCVFCHCISSYINPRLIYESVLTTDMSDVFVFVHLSVLHPACRQMTRRKMRSRRKRSHSDTTVYFHCVPVHFPTHEWCLHY